MKMNFKNIKIKVKAKNFNEDINVFQRKFDVYDLVQKKAIPLDPKMMDYLGWYEKDVYAFHATNERHLEWLIKNQNKEVFISTFTKGGGKIVTLPSQPNVILKLKGDVLIKGDADLMTLVDDEGLRWINQDTNKNTKLSFFIQGIISSIKKEFNVQDIRKIPKEKLKKAYFRKIQQFLDKNYKEFIKYLKNPSDTNYDELVMTRYKIIECWSLQVQNEKVKSICEKYGIKYSGAISLKEVANLKVKESSISMKTKSLLKEVVESINWYNDTYTKGFLGISQYLGIENLDFYFTGSDTFIVKSSKSKAIQKLLEENGCVLIEAKENKLKFKIKDERKFSNFLKELSKNV